ncbi:MAG: SusC/RagA family TonB-linked outer membrane protein [Mucilaginibacter sp.]
MRFFTFLCMCLFALSGLGFGMGSKNISSEISIHNLNSTLIKDTVIKGKSILDSSKKSSAPKKANPKIIDAGSTFLDPSKISKLPVVSLQQFLKGQVSGVYGTEPSGEPGTVQNLFIRGISMPVFSAKDQFQSQPTIVVDGIPVISYDHPFAYDIQQYDFNRIGPATNILANIDPENIASIEVLKDLSESGKYGPRAANGIISITTKRASYLKKISFNTYIGLATPDAVTTLNGADENAFRKPFYTKYATFDQIQNIPAYLRDSSYTVYYGPSNWTDLYYKNTLQYGLNISITGGVDNANFRAAVGSLRDNSVADASGLSRYNASFMLNMKPTKWLSFTATMSASQLWRDRNKYFRDRFAEVRYLPDLTNPISPNKDYYAQFLREYDKAFDNNKTNIVDASFVTKMTFGKFNFISTFSTDYSGGYRDIFYPRTLLETNNYVSNYFGYNQRVIMDNKVAYNLSWHNTHFIDLEGGQSVQLDRYRYDYSYAYNGSSDYIKLNIQDTPKPNIFATPTANSGGYLFTNTFRFIDQTQNNLLSYYARAGYHYKDKYKLSLLLRGDGSSNQQPTSRWFLSPILSGEWNIKNDLLPARSAISELALKTSIGRVGRVQQDDRYAAGPQYTVDIGFTGQPRIGSYQGLAPLNRPYNLGWVGYNIPWAYTEQENVGLDMGLWHNRLRASVDLYSRTDKNEIINVPANADYGYAYAAMPGMSVNNSGIDVELSADILPAKSKFQWTPSISFNFNRNVLKALPGGINQLVVGTGVNSRLLQVGKSIDQYWLLQNQGIYNRDSEVPVNPNGGAKLSFHGIPLKAGDPKWNDLNGDYNIDDNDKVLQGHSLPVVSGGINNDFRYKSWSLGVNLYYNLGRNIINQAMANRFDFINQQSANDINSVKEITFWQKMGDYSKYPVYNPWSDVIPYRTDQDLFLENGSFIKLRSVSLSYDMMGLFKKSKITKFLIYTSVTNVFTLTPYTGRDPELVDYKGYDTGYGQPIPRTYTLGIKMDL